MVNRQWSIVNGQCSYAPVGIAVFTCFCLLNRHAAHAALKATILGLQRVAAKLSVYIQLTNGVAFLFPTSSDFYFNLLVSGKNVHIALVPFVNHSFGRLCDKWGLSEALKGRQTTDGGASPR